MSLGQPRRQAGRQGSAPRYRVATRRRIPHPTSRVAHAASRIPHSSSRSPHPAAMAGRRWAGRCAALALLLAACSLPRGGSAGRLFLNEWAAEIPAGPDAAKAIADELDYDLVGQVRPGGDSIPQDAPRRGSFPTSSPPSNLCPAAARGAPGSSKLPVLHHSLPGSGSFGWDRAGRVGSSPGDRAGTPGSP